MVRFDVASVDVMVAARSAARSPITNEAVALTKSDTT